jgi:hypothetical protein
MQAALGSMLQFAADCNWRELYFVEHFAMQDVLPVGDALV